MAWQDKIEKKVTMRAPVSKVWKALTDVNEFARWFGVKLQGEFVAGKTVTGTFDGSLDEADIIEFQKKKGLKASGIKMPAPDAVFCTVERVEPERYFSFRWIPYGIDAEADPANEPTTLVEFQLEPSGGGTVMTVVESGFAKVPAHRRERAFLMNDGGWEEQAQNLKKYVEGT